MKIVSFVSGKGGTGKSSLARHVAVAAHTMGVRYNEEAPPITVGEYTFTHREVVKPLKVIVLDVDQQATLRGWHAERKRPPEVIAETSTARRFLDQRITEIRDKGTDLLIVDTPGTWEGAYTANALAIADFALVPCRPTGEDTEAFWATEERIKAAGKRWGAVVSQAPTTTRKPEQDLLRMWEAEGIPHCPTVIHFRQAVAASYASGSTVIETYGTTDSDQKAGQEMRALWLWLSTQLNFVEHA
jgi:chromosome partitioning protein